MNISTKIKELRTSKGWTQEHLAVVSGKTLKTIQRVELGNNPSLDTQQALASAFDMNVEELQKNEDLEIKDSVVNDFSWLHKQIPELSKELYKQLKFSNSTRLNFDKSFYENYSRPLARLEKNGYIEGYHALGVGKFAQGMRISTPEYIIYMCSLEENSKIGILSNIVDKCTVGHTLHGDKVSEQVSLPLPVVEAIFEIYNRKGYGAYSKDSSSSQYRGTA